MFPEGIFLTAKDTQKSVSMLNLLIFSSVVRENLFRGGLHLNVFFFLLESVIFIMSVLNLMSNYDSPPGYLLGGHVVRLFHGHDECLTIPSTDQNDSQHK